MIDGYINISEAAEKWVIPVTAEKPGDDRFVNGKYVAWRKESPKIRETNTEIKKGILTFLLPVLLVVFCLFLYWPKNVRM